MAALAVLAALALAAPAAWAQTPEQGTLDSATATAGDGSVTFNWSYTVGTRNLTSWQFKEKVGNGNFAANWTIMRTDGEQLPKTARTWTRSGLTNGTTYTYRIRGFAGSPTNVITTNPVTPSDGSTTVVGITAGAAVTEGTAAQFTVSVSAAPSAALTVNLTVSESAGRDYVAPGDEGSKTVMIAANTTSATYSVATEGDTRNEPNGTVTVTVDAGTGYTVGTTSSASVTVNDDDDAPTAPCGTGSGPVRPQHFTVTAEISKIRVAYTNQGGNSQRYFLCKSGSSTIHRTTAHTHQNQHTFTNLDHDTDYWVGVQEGGGTPFAWKHVRTLVDPTVGPEITIAGGTAVTEGTAAEFTVTAAEAPTADLVVNLTVSESSDGDYVASGNEGSKTVTIAANTTSATYSVTTEADTTNEPNGTVTVAVASGTGYSVGTTSSADVTVNDDDPPAISGVEITSSPAFGDTYRRGENIEVTVTWDEDVTWNVSATNAVIRVRVQIGPLASVQRWATLVRGGATSGTARSLAFRYAVVQADTDSDGVTVVPTNAGVLVRLLSSATLQDSAGTAASGEHAGLTTAQTDHKVDGSVVTTAPVAPGAPTVGVASTTSLSVSWSAPTSLGSASSITDYDLRYFAGTADPTDAADWIEEGEMNGPPDPGTATSATITGLTEDTAYRVQVRAMGDLESPWSASASGTPKKVAPSAPAAPTVSAASSSSLSVSWSAPDNLGSASSITDYDLRYFAGAADPTDPADWIEEGETSGPPNPGSNTSATITGLTADTAYRVQVRAMGDLESPWSASADGTPVNQPPKFTATDNNPADNVINAPAGTLVSLPTDRAGFSDPDGDTLTFSVSHSPENTYAAFQDDSADGEPGSALRRMFFSSKGECELANLDPPLSGVKPQTTVTLTATDPSGGTAEITRRFVLTNYGNTNGVFCPSLTSAAVNLRTLTLTYEGGIGRTPSGLKGSEFTVKVAQTAVDLADTDPVTIGTPTTSGSRDTTPVTLKLAASVAHGATVTVSHAPGATPSTVGYTDSTVTNNTPDDTTAPTFQSAAVVGTTLKIVFDEVLDEDSTPATSAFAVTVAGNARSVSNVDISGSTVTLTLASAAVGGETVTVQYTKPSANPLRDLVATPNAVANFGPEDVTNNDNTAPTYSSSSVNGASLTLTFDEALDGASTPAAGAFTVTVGGESASRTVSGVAISGATVTLTLAKMVARGETVKVRYTKPSANPLRDVALNEVATFGDQAVTNTTPPVFRTATANRAAVTLTFDAALATASKPAASAFAVTVAGSTRSVSNVAVAGSTVTLTLASAAGEGDAVTGTYTAPGTNPLQDAAGNPVANFSFTAANHTDTTAPVVQGTPTVNRATLIVTFDEDLDTDSVPAAAAFTVDVADSSRDVSNVAVADSTVRLTLASAVSAGQEVTAGYAGGALRDADGNTVVAFGPLDVTNNTPPPPPPPPPGGGGDPAPSSPLTTEETIDVGETTYEAGDHEVTVRREAGTPAVRLALPGTLAGDVEVTISAVAPDVPLESGTFGLGPARAQTVVDVDVDNVPSGGLTLCLPATAALREAAAGEPLVLLHWRDGRWTEVPGAALNPAGTHVCATVTSFSPFAVGYRTDVAPRFDRPAPSLVLADGEAMDPVVLPAATGGNGELTYTLASAPAGLAGLSFNAATRRLSGTPDTAGEYGFTYTVHDADANRADSDAAVLTFTVTVEDPRTAQVRQSVRRTLAAVARRSLTSALDNIGARFAASVPASGLTLAGHAVPLGTATGTGLTDMDKGQFCLPGSSGSSGLPGVTDGFGAAHENCVLVTRGMTSEEMLRASAFTLTLGAAGGSENTGNTGTGAPSAPQWAVWGRGDLGTFAGRPEPGMGYEGELRTGWLGVDARSGAWVAGLALSHGTGEADYDFAAGGVSGQGRLETSLTALYPYGRWTLSEGLELRGVLGAGSGEARHRLDGDAGERSDLSMWMGSLGLRREFPSLGEIDLAARADASVARMETDDGPAHIANLSADSWRLRAGLEASRRFALDGDAALEPFVEAAARRDGGDGLEGTGLEIAGGLRYTAPRLHLEMRGRWLASHSEEGAEESGVSVTARLGPGAQGRGLSLSLSPRWGAGTGGAEALWRDELPGPAGSGSTAAMDARIGYGFSWAPYGLDGLLTPFAETSISGEDSRRLRLGARFEASRTNLGIELAGERLEGGTNGPEHAIRLDLGWWF